MAEIPDEAMKGTMNELYLIDGLYLGQLSEFEFEVFERAVREGKAVRQYAGLSGFLGLARVKLIRDGRTR